MFHTIFPYQYFLSFQAAKPEKSLPASSLSADHIQPATSSQPNAFQISEACAYLSSLKPAR
jgi:hypothetical protein